MAMHGLHRIFAPSSVAVIGASERETSVGRTVLRNLCSSQFAGEVWSVNPKHSHVDGRPCYATVSDLPRPADLAVICIPAASVPELVRDCGRAGIFGIIIISAGFREAGGEGLRLEQELAGVLREFPEMRIVGPNCLGIMSPHHGLNASFAGDAPAPGNVAFISQSGALCTSVLDWAQQENVGFSHFVSVGNMLDVSVADLIDYFASDGHTTSIILYVESINETRQFLSAARAFTKTRPIIAYKAGRFTESAQAAASHTGAMAGVDSVYEAAMVRAGIVRVFDIDELFNCAELLSRQKTPAGPRLAIVTNAGGPGVMASDCLLERHGKLARLSEKTLDTLDSHLPPAWSGGNPVDVLGDAGAERFAVAVSAVMADPQVDGVLVILTPQAMTDATAAAEAVVAACRQQSKPVLASWMGGNRVQSGVARLNAAGIPTYHSPEKAVRAFMHLVAYARNRETLYETPREMPLEFPLDRSKLRAVFDTILSEGHDILSETTSKALLQAYEIPVSKAVVARTADDAVAYADGFGYPVALKVFSPDITHKTDVAGVALNLSSPAQVQAAFRQILEQAAKLRPQARVEGVTVQRMVVEPASHELIVGAKRDPVFGTVLLVGAGGITAELFHDRALELPPLSERLARRMLESLKSWPLLCGYRGRPGVNIDRLTEVLMRVSYLVADYPEIVELDINPLLATPRDAIALDARIVLDHQTLLHPPRPYSHLAIRPYPEEYVRRVKLPDGGLVCLRPIRPEDEPQWHALLANSSPDTLRRRFRYMFRASTHELATRFCFIDYDRELAMVAEMGDGPERHIVGVGRLIADADHQEAEYAVLVGDPWQGRGLGSLLTDYCLEICRLWGVQLVTAQVAADNARMIGMFQRRGFELTRPLESDTVVANLRLPS